MFKKILLSIVMLVFTSVCYAEIIDATVVKVYDGDTVTVRLQDGSKARIRFGCIDAPESTQEYGQASREALSSLISDSDIQVDIMNYDMYGRIVGIVYCDGLNVNMYMVQNGNAWHYKAFDKSADYDKYEQLEANAREEKIGLWAYDNPMQPWIYRRLKKKGLL